MASTITRKCTSCGDCVSLCPSASIYMGVKHHVIDSDTCDNCHVCITVCPENAVLPGKVEVIQPAPIKDKKLDSPPKK